MMYGYLDKNYFPVFTTFVTGENLAFCYATVFYISTKNRKKANIVLAVSALLMAITTSVAFLAGYGVTGQSRGDAATTVGIIAMVTGTILYSSPLEKVFHLFKHKSAAFLPIHIVCAGTTNNAVWVTYTYLAKKWLIFGPCVFAMCLGLFQMFIYFVVFHPSTHPLEVTSEGNETTKESTPKNETDGSAVSIEIGAFAAVQTPRA